MEGIGRFSGNNIGGINAMQLIDVNDVADIAFPDVDYIINNSIALKNAADWGSITFTFETCSFEEKDKLSDAGRLYEQELSFIVPKVSPELQKWKHENIHKRFVIVFKDNNEQNYVFGSLQSPVELASKASIPSGVGSRNQVELTFKCGSTMPLPVYLMAEIVEAINRRSFTSEFTFEFS